MVGPVRIYFAKFFDSWLHAKDSRSHLEVKYNYSKLFRHAA